MQSQNDFNIILKLAIFARETLHEGYYYHRGLILL